MKAITTFLLTGVMFAVSTTASAQLIPQQRLSYALAKTIADITMDTCTAGGSLISVHVVDQGGDTIIALRGEGARPHTFENSYEKAFTAMTFGRPSQQMEDEYIAGDLMRAQQADFPNVVALGGGLPIRAGEEIVGGIGVSGGGPAGTEACAQAALDAVAAQLQ
jgi:uncharacterized protein GlcG (DUF336 family)